MITNVLAYEQTSTTSQVATTQSLTANNVDLLYLYFPLSLWYLKRKVFIAP